MRPRLLFAIDIGGVPSNTDPPMFSFSCTVHQNDGGKVFRRGIMGGAAVYPHSVLHLRLFPSFSPKSANPVFSLKEIADRSSFPRIRADGNRRERPPRGNTSPGKVPRIEGSENSQMFEGGSSSKEQILALFKRIQASISKGETLDSKKKSSNNAEVMASAESVLEVLRQPRTQRKAGKTVVKKGDKFPAPRKDESKKEQIPEQSIAKAEDSIPTRPPSSFARRSPIPPPSKPSDTVQIEPEIESLSAASEISEQQSKKFEDMKLPELKEVAKSKGIRGYSKLKKSELVELLIK